MVLPYSSTTAFTKRGQVRGVKTLLLQLDVPHDSSGPWMCVTPIHKLVDVGSIQQAWMCLIQSSDSNHLHRRF